MRTRRALAATVAVTTAAGVATLGPVTLPAGAAAPQPILTSSTMYFYGPALSSSGRYLAYFGSFRDESEPTQLLWKDLKTGQTELINPSLDGGTAVGSYNGPPEISNDGNRVAFGATANRLVENDVNDVNDAFVRDIAAGTTLLASVAANGDAANDEVGVMSMSASGRWVVFASLATDVIPGTPFGGHLYLRDLATDTTTLVSVRPDGTPVADAYSNAAGVSSNGNRVFFNSRSDEILKTDDNDGGATDLYVRNMTTGKTRWLTKGAPAGAEMYINAVSPNGQWVASAGWTDGALHLINVNTGTATLLPGGEAGRGSFSNQLGRLVYSSNGVPYVLDLATGVSSPIDIPAAGGSVGHLTISGNGRFVAYDWAASDGSGTGIYRVAL